ncbi:Fur family transcriptional regulator [Vampirovibrio sp.]|uniref:Fur family transcriptional regulator n=1 Tax=Vampirovibrio sp. TaxID=2717857 RepID=UPI003593E804
MSKYSEQAIAILKQKGFRITRPRMLVLELLDRTERTLSAYEIKDILDESGEKVDTVSVYRILECLEENHLIHRVLSSGRVMKCHLEHEQEDQQEHLIISCQGCGSIEEIQFPEVDKIIRSIEKLSTYKIQNHNLEFFGLCRQCE